MTQVAENLPSKLRALSLNHSTGKKKKKKKSENNTSVLNMCKLFFLSLFKQYCTVYIVLGMMNT
jgi:hypothetical protein